VRSCQITIAQAEGTFVTTIEGLSRDRGHPVQQAWVSENLPQCGYCQPGMIMAAAALLAEKPDPSDEDINRAITNICRCGTYPRIRRAIQLASRVQAGREKIAAAPPGGIAPEDAAQAVSALVAPKR
jgi:isoquinoline 1-oxidoreductase alpha subunit